MSAKVLLIGIDSGDEALLLRWIDEGALPTLGALRQSGAWAPVVNPPRMISGAVWPTLFTAVTPARHGRYFRNGLIGYTVTGERNPDVRQTPFWDVLSRERRKVAILDVPYATLSDEINGIQLIDWIAHDRSYPPVHGHRGYDYRVHSRPPSLASEVTERYGKDELPDCERPNRSRVEIEAFRNSLLDRVQRKTNLASDYLARDDWDLFMLVFADSHCVGHECWHVHDPTHPRHDAALARAVGDPIKDVYVAIDAAIGRLLVQAGPDTLAFVFASHGMGPNYVGSFLLDHILGLLDDDGALRSLGMVQTLNRTWTAMPTFLRTVLHPIRVRWKSQVKESLVSQHRKMGRCFALPTSDDYGGIRVNLVGREPAGRIRPGAELEAFRQRLTQDLLALVDAEDGQPLVRAVVDYEDVHPTDNPYTAMLYDGQYEGEKADFLVVWNKPYFTSVRSPKFGTVDLRHAYQGSRMGDHRTQGLAFACGPSIRPGRLPAPISVMDIAPTIAARLGVSLPNVDGVPIEALSAPIVRRASGGGVERKRESSPEEVG
jgi:predicted AlkP superfamily phosphohydrolase/phosphomutase